MDTWHFKVKFFSPFFSAVQGFSSFTKIILTTSLVFLG